MTKKNERQVTFDEAEEFSASRGAKYFIECSAKTGYNIDNIFYEAAKYIYNSKNLYKIDINSNKQKIDQENNHKKSLLNKFFNNNLKFDKDNNEDNTYKKVKKNNDEDNAYKKVEKNNVDNNYKKVKKNKINSEFSSNYILNKYSNF